VIGGLIKLSRKRIDLDDDELRMLAAQGVPNGAGVRSTVWTALAFLAIFNFLQ
jgi:hypothetical protein